MHSTPPTKRVTVNYLLTNFGYFSIIPVIPLLIVNGDSEVSAVAGGLALGVLSFASRGGTLFIGPVLERFSVRQLFACGTLIVAASLCLLGLVEKTEASLLIALGALGLGIAVINFSARGYVLARLEEKKDQVALFSTIQMVGNVAAATGPLIANFIVTGANVSTLLISVGSVYILALAVSPFTLATGVYIRDDKIESRSRIFATLRIALTSKGLRKAAVAVALGSLFYAQLFSGMVIEFAEITESPAIRGSFFAVNAIAVIVLQIPVGRVVARRVDRGTTATSVLYVSIAVFAVSLFVFALARASGSLSLVYLAVVVFSIAECFYAPMVNIAMTETGVAVPLVDLLNLRLVAAAIGEGVGAFLGFTMLAVARDAGSTWPYWMALAVLGLITAGASSMTTRKGVKR